MKSSLLNRAIQFAAQAHRNQLRKGTDLPYIVHPFAVGMILSQFGFSERVIAAGLLHDTLEDTGVTEHALAGEFGHEIATVVAACSEPDKSLPWRERKQHTIDSLITAPWQVKSVVAADKLDNLRAMSADFAQIGDALWQRFKQGREQQEWYYRADARTRRVGRLFGQWVLYIHQFRAEFDAPNSRAIIASQEERAWDFGGHLLWREDLVDFPVLVGGFMNEGKPAL